MDSDVDNPLENVPEEKIEEILSDYSGLMASSLHGLAYVYGRLELLAKNYRVEGDVSQEYILYMTPNKKVDDMFNEDGENLLSLKVDLTDDEPVYKGVEAEPLTWKKTIKCGYCRPENKSGRVIAHSICQLTSTSGYDIENTVSKIEDRVTRWPSDDNVQEGVSGHSDEWIVNSLDSFGDQVENSSELQSQIENDVKNAVGNDSFSGLISVKVDVGDGFQYPGELDVFNEGMVSKKRNKLSSKSAADDSQGEAVDYITGEETTVYGHAPGSPLNYFTGKQVTPFSEFDADQSWRDRPLSAETSLTISMGSGVIESMIQAVTPDGRIAAMPWFNEGTEITADDLKELYGVMEEIRHNNNPISAVHGWLSQRSGDSQFNSDSIDEDIFNDETMYNADRSAYIVVFNQDQSSLYDVVGETRQVDVFTAEKVSGSVNDLLTHPLFGELFEGIRTDLETGENEEDESSWVEQGSDVLQSLLSRTFYEGTVQYDRFGESDIIDPMDGIFTMTMRTLSGTPISYRELMGEYVDRLETSRNYMLSESDSSIPHPNGLVWKQHLQLLALSESDMLEMGQRKDYKGLLTEDYHMLDGNYENREERLDAYLNSHEPLKNNSEYRSAFLLGGLIGRISQKQRYMDVSSTLASKYGPKHVSRESFHRIVTEVLQKNTEYSDMEGYELNERYTQRLRDSAVDRGPQDFSIPVEELQYWFALGVSYGMEDSSMSTDE